MVASVVALHCLHRLPRKNRRQRGKNIFILMDLPWPLSWCMADPCFSKNCKILLGSPGWQIKNWNQIFPKVHLLCKLYSYTVWNYQKWRFLLVPSFKNVLFSLPVKSKRANLKKNPDFCLCLTFCTVNFIVIFTYGQKKYYFLKFENLVFLSFLRTRKKSHFFSWNEKPRYYLQNNTKTENGPLHQHNMG